MYIMIDRSSIIFKVRRRSSPIIPLLGVLRLARQSMYM
jgi:hypothetical protein